jgi:hypothetical protein
VAATAAAYTGSVLTALAGELYSQGAIEKQIRELMFPVYTLEDIRKRGAPAILDYLRGEERYFRQQGLKAIADQYALATGQVYSSWNLGYQ